MANTITLAKSYIDNLDLIYKNASVTADLISDSTLIRAGNNVNEIVIPKISMDGLKDYSRNDGYKKGSVSLEWETKKFNYDRGTKFTVDTMDNEETMMLAFGQLTAEFIRTKVAPEADAFTFSKLAQTSGISKGAEKTIATGEEVLDELLIAVTKMDEDEVPVENRILYITPTLHNLATSVKTYINSGILDTFTTIKKVPQNRFYTQIDLTADGAGGYTKNGSAKDINFMIVHKPAIIKWTKHVAQDIIPAKLNSESDGNILKYRNYGIVEVFDNKVAGIYMSNKAGE